MSTRSQAGRCGSSGIGGAAPDVDRSADPAIVTTSGSPSTHCGRVGRARDRAGSRARRAPGGPRRAGRRRRRQADRVRVRRRRPSPPRRRAPLCGARGRSCRNRRGASFRGTSCSGSCSCPRRTARVAAELGRAWPRSPRFHRPAWRRTAPPRVRPRGEAQQFEGSQAEDRAWRGVAASRRNEGSRSGQPVSKARQNLSFFRSLTVSA